LQTSDWEMTLPDDVESDRLAIFKKGVRLNVEQAGEPGITSC